MRIGKSRHALKGDSLARLGRTLAAIVLAIACNYTLSRLGLLHGLERLVLDWEMTAGNRATADIVIVKISDLEYDDFFGGRSPLAWDKLRRLIGALARSGPKVIGVDIDTSHPQFRDLKPDPGWPPVIWERDVANFATGGEFEPADVLGGQDPSLNRASGIPALLDDAEDRVTRLYTRCIATKAGPEPSFVFAAAQAFRDGTTARIADLCRDNAPDREQPSFIQYSTVWTSIPAAQVHLRSDTKENGGQGQAIVELKDKLVLLGGTYRDVDRHFTPLGTLPGVLVLANAVQTELNGGAAQAYPRWALFLLEFGSGAVLVLIFQIWELSLGRMLVLGPAMVLGLSLALSMIAFHSWSRVTSFAPTLLAILIFEIFEHVRHESIFSVAHRD